MLFIQLMLRRGREIENNVSEIELTDTKRRTARGDTAPPFDCRTAPTTAVVELGHPTSAMSCYSSAQYLANVRIPRN
jgi:hypothetical protein